MTSDRMRRVNEAMREVLSGAITSELKDPRVGFVTVTAVETSPDLRHARVFVSVLGNPGERRRSLQALDNAHGFLQRRVGGELRMKNTPQLAVRLRRHGRARHADHRAARRRKTAPDGGPTGRSRRARRCSAPSARRERFCLTTHEKPDGDAVGSLAGMQQVLAALGKDAIAFMPAEEFPLPYEYRFIQLEGLLTELPADLARARRWSSSTAATSTARRWRATARVVAQHRPSPRQHALRDGQPRRPAGVVHGGDGLGPHARPRRDAHARHRRGALRRPGHRHRALHVREHRAARARDGGRADRRRARPARDLPAPLRGRPAGQAASCWRAGSPTSSASTTAC